MDNSDYEVDPLDVLAPLPTTSFSPSPVFHAKGNSLFAEVCSIYHNTFIKNAFYFFITSNI